MFLEYQSIYSCFLSKITDKKILKYSEEDFEEIALDYLHNTIAITYIRNLFQEITFDDLLKTIEFKLKKSIDKISDENFASKVINDENLGNIEFELKKIERIVSTILSRIEREKRK